LLEGELIVAGALRRKTDKLQISHGEASLFDGRKNPFGRLDNLKNIRVMRVAVQRHQLDAHISLRHRHRRMDVRAPDGVQHRDETGFALAFP
jgi:hypothetical protein